ncbi:hypothetical protein TI04_10890, partial [Achromatium sp. WMS2]
MVQITVELLEFTYAISPYVNSVITSIYAKFYYLLNIFRSSIIQAPDWVSWLLVVGLVLAGLGLMWQGLARRSLLVKLDALDLDPDNPLHLSGRDKDLDALVAATVFRPLVFLEGEAGVGKTALIKSGLIPKLQQSVPDSGLIPLYINCYPEDWDQGLYQRLTLAIWYEITTLHLHKLQLQSFAELEAWLAERPEDQGILQHLQHALGQRLLIIFDQFEDYLTIQHQHFIIDGRWLTNKELISTNQFWREVNEELERKTIHCLFVTRRRWTMALDALRFRPPVLRTLSLVAADAIGDLLTKLTAPQTLDASKQQVIISHPNAGWIALRDLLIQDLTNQGRILPIHARVAFKGLTILSELSIGTYEVIGRLEGLEREYIHTSMAQAAKAARISIAQVRNILMTMVDETVPLMAKAKTASTGRISTLTKIDLKRVQRALLALTQSGLVRSGLLDPQTESQCSWTLHHDYLARLIITTHRYAARWQRFLQARSHTFYTV